MPRVFEGRAASLTTPFEDSGRATLAQMILASGRLLSTIGTVAPSTPRSRSMLWAMYEQQLDPLKGSVLWSPVWSTVIASVPVVVLFWLLVFRRWLASKAAAAGAVAALVLAVVVYQMPPVMAGMAFLNGAAFGLMPVGWTIFSAMLLYNITVE